MKMRFQGPVLLALTIGLLGLGGCPKDKVKPPDNRGLFTAGACKDDGTAMGRKDVPAGAVTAVYFDINMQPVGAAAEDLEGTVDKKMCPTPPVGGPGGCSPKPPWCVVPINGKNYCLRCQ